MDESKNPGLERAIALGGGITALTRALGLKSHAVVHSWRLNRVPAEHCPLIEAATGVRCEELRPDVRWDVLRGSATSAANDAHGAQAAQQGVANA
jgi:DNA-binding transcriptional regulator YdaS (Cro superfamily)